MRRFDLTDPEAAFERGLYVAPPDEHSARRVIASAELGATKRYALIGGVGSGKSTWMLAACRGADATSSEVRAEYVDVNEHVRLGELAPGALVTAAARALAQDAGAGVSDVEVLRRTARDGSKRSVVFLDSLERVDDDASLLRTLRQDLEALQKVGISVVATVPLRWAFLPALRGDLEDRFDDVLTVAPVDIDDGEGQGGAFLRNVLTRRDPAGMLSDEAKHALADASGGVMRDLLALAQGAAQEMYLHGGAAVSAGQVATVASRFGKTLLHGLSSHELDVLLEVKRTGYFDPKADDDIALIVSRRILRYPDGRRRFVVHPAMAPLLESRREAA